MAETDKKNKIAVYCCENSAYQAVQTVTDENAFKGIEIIPLPCSGKVERALILKTLELGYAGVLVLACPKDNCKFVRGSYRAEKRVEMIRESLRRVGVEGERVRIGFLSSVDGHKFVHEVEQMKAGLFGETVKE